MVVNSLFHIAHKKFQNLLNTLRKKFHFQSKPIAYSDTEQSQEIEELKNLLQKMSIMSFKGEIYSGNSHSVFTIEFVKCAVSLLSTFLSAITSGSNGPKESVTIALHFYQIKDIIDWIESIEQTMRESSWF